MIALEFFSWWYGRGWLQLVKNADRRLIRASRMFSIPILLRTLFAPWRRIVTYPGQGLGDHLRAAADNVISRMVGFVVRIIVLLSATVVMLGVIIVSAAGTVIWPLLPLLVIVTAVKGAA